MTSQTKTPFVLIVEDDRDVAAFIRHVMDLAGYRTEIAPNGKVAIEYLYENPPEIVLLDLSLPEVSGVEVLQILKSDDRLKKTLVVVVTANSQIAADLPVVPDLILLKPVSPNQLTDLVWRLLQGDKNLEKLPFGKDPWDKATGLYSRAFFINRLDSALKNSKNNKGNLFGVLLVTPSQNKTPDKKQKALILQEVASSLKTSVRPTDTISRFEKDHFFILVENIKSAEILSNITDRIHPSEGVSFSIGAMLCDDGYDDIDEILRDVKTAHSLPTTDGQKHPRIFTRDSINNTQL
jgi:PleD family two-component response regulator